MAKPFAFVLILTVVCAAGAWAAERLAVSVSSANIRSGPGTNYPIKWKVGKYHPVMVIKKSEKWYYFKDFEGDTGWISATLVGKAKTVVVKKNKCNVRSGPDTKHDVVFTVDKGVSFKILERKGKWVHVLHADGDKGWIHGNLIW